MAVGDPIPPSWLLRRVATTTITAASATFTTTETAALATVTGFLEAGQRYAITAEARFSASAVASPSLEATLARIREDTATGTEIGFSQVSMLTASTLGFGVRVYTEYTAVSSGSKSFVLTGVRQSGANNHSLRAGTSGPGFLYIDLLLS